MDLYCGVGLFSLSGANHFPADFRGGGSDWEDWEDWEDREDWEDWEDWEGMVGKHKLNPHRTITTTGSFTDDKSYRHRPS